MIPRLRPLPWHPRLFLSTFAVWLVLSGIFAFMLFRFHGELHAEIRSTVIGRDAAVLHPVARSQLAAVATRGGPAVRSEELLTAVLQSAQQDGMLAVAVFDAQGALVRALPASLLFAELSASDYVSLLAGGPLSRYHPEFPLDRYFAGASVAATAPVLEVLLSLESRADGARLGFAQYIIDARTLGGELAAIDDRLRRQTLATVGIGTVLIGLVLSGLYLGLARAQRQVAERNERLARANFELTLAAKASVLGQITSHLLHGLQGSVAGLRAVVANAPADADWHSAAGHTDRMQSLISETVALLGDPGAAYELTGQELATIIRDRNAAAAAVANVRLVVGNLMTCNLDGQRGSLLCLIATNLVSNAVAATPAGRRVLVELASDRTRQTLTVADEGGGIPAAVRPRLFEPGVTTRPGGTGLGLAISRLLARQIGGELTLVSTGPAGTVFRVELARPA